MRQVLQRGRARAGAEINTSRLVGPVNITLQRGRARAGAEIRALAFGSCQRTNSFNGAAPARARKSSTRPSGSRSSRMLQRGRARAGAEIACGGSSWRLSLMLQRGRARAGAEIWRLEQFARS